MFTKVLYAAILYLLISYAEDKGKAKLALKKAWRSFGSILPSEPAILLLCGFILTFLNLQTISRLLGADSRALGMVIAAAVGCAALIPGFAAFPLAASLLAARQADDA
ncbi:MAG: permease [Oscillibacter sp.]|nr:permease [Oscillibacter sp.]